MTPPSYAHCTDQELQSLRLNIIKYGARRLEIAASNPLGTPKRARADRERAAALERLVAVETEILSRRQRPSGFPTTPESRQPDSQTRMET